MSTTYKRSADTSTSVIPQMTDKRVRPRRDKQSKPRRDQFSIATLLLLVAGVAVAFWVMRPLLPPRFESDTGPIGVIPVVLRLTITVLGGVSFVGVPILLFRARRDRSRWGPGRIAWSAHGSASWLLWPPIVMQRSGNSEGDWSAVCWLWGTPLMGVYMTAALLAGGWLRRRGRPGLRRNWSERFGLLLTCLWACTGLYFLYLLYNFAFFGKS